MGQEKIIGIDSSIFIYSLEENPFFVEKSQSLLNSIEEGRVQGIFSIVGMIEVLTGPKLKKQFELAYRYRELLKTFPNLVIVGITEDIVDRASDLRADYGIRTPDAIHIASALCHGASIFYTNDVRLKKIKDIAVKLL
jgi:predicted nucleic acid-binding protein